MSLVIPMDWEAYRFGHPLFPGEIGDRHNGFFKFPKRGSIVICSNGADWEHASMSVKDRCPTWAEMEYIKRALWAPEDVCMQLHVPVSDHKNLHPYCLHLWRPLAQLIPLPPSSMVAP